MENYINIGNTIALNYIEACASALKLLDVNVRDWSAEKVKEIACGGCIGYSYKGDHGEQCYVKFEDLLDDYYMNTATGSIESIDVWIKESESWEGDIDSKLKSLVRVVRINGEWVEA